MNHVTAVPRWSLRDLPYGSPQELAAALTRLEGLVQTLEDGRARLRDELPVADSLALLLDVERIYALSAELGAYTCLYCPEKTQNPDAQRTRAHLRSSVHIIHQQSIEGGES